MESHWCSDCQRPDYDFSAADLAVLDRALELLSREQDWDPDHEGECPDARGPLSLQCAVWRAVAEQGHAPLDLPAPSEVVYEALERLPGEERVDAPLERFNNRSGTAFADVRGLLLDVRERVAAEIEEEKD